MAIGEQGSNAGAEEFFVRCCADVEGTACAPSQAPTFMPTPAPTPAPSLFPTSSPPSEVPTPGPTTLPLSCASPAALYDSIVGQSAAASAKAKAVAVEADGGGSGSGSGSGSGGMDWACTELGVGEAPGGLAQRMCSFAPEHCGDDVDWRVCRFGVRSSTLTLYTPPSYDFRSQPSILFCTQGCTECLAK